MATQRSRSWLERGTLRQPGPHLDRLPVGIDLAGISLAEGLRAAVASGLLVLLSVWLHSFPLLLAAFAANLTCFCDAGGPLAGRLRALLAFTMLGALAWMGFGLLRNLAWPVIVPLAGAAIFLCSMARVWGVGAQAVGNLLIVTVALALDKPLGTREAATLGVSFVAGGLWSVVLTLVIWRVHPGHAASRAVDQAWAALAELAADLRRLATDAESEAAWDGHARAHRRSTRMTLDEARRHTTDAARSRGPMSPTVRRMVIRLETAETVFAALIALGDVMERSDPAVRLSGARALRLLRPVLALWGKGVLGSSERFEPVFARAEGYGRAAPALAPPLRAVSDAMRVTAKASTSPETGEPTPTLLAASERSRFEGLLGPLRENLTWDSAILRHAVRATAVTLPALAWALVWWSPYAHWLTITLALTMQPYFAATWQRVLERVGGTLLGGLIGAAVAFLPESGLTRAALLVPLCVVGFSVRQVSYGAYIACLTPLVVVLFDVAEPGHSDATIAAMRFTYTVLGGGLALVASLLLWPRWDSRRLRQEIAFALEAYAAFARSSLATNPTEAHDPVSARRAAGVASNNLEAALSRALQEPERIRTRELEIGLVVDAALRRLAGALLALAYEADPSQAERDAWRRWTSDSLMALAQGRSPMLAAPEAPAASTSARVGRIIATIDHALLDGTSRSVVMPEEIVGADLRQEA